MATKRKAKSKAGIGGTFEQAIQSTCDAYAAIGIAFLSKVDPPTKVIRMRGRAVVIHLENPFLDFTGSWTERGGQMIMVEAKNNEKPSLPVAEKGDGISLTQLRNASIWEASGAAVLFLWQRAGAVRFLTVSMVKAQLATGRKSVAWLEAHPVPQGDNFAFIDFLAILRALNPTTTTDQNEQDEDL